MTESDSKPIIVSPPPVWLRGPVEGVPDELQGVAQGLLESLEEVVNAMRSFPEDMVWAKPLGVAAVGFHIQHMTGATDRLFTYARSEALKPSQVKALMAERNPDESYPLVELMKELEVVISSSIEQLRATPVSTLNNARPVGSKKLPSTVRGLLEHAAQHACRHSGQIVTTTKIAIKVK